MKRWGTNCIIDGETSGDAAARRVDVEVYGF